MSRRIEPRHFFAEATVQRRARILSLVLLGSAVAATSAQITDQAPSIRPVDGAGIFRNYCAACHGLDGRGNGPVSKVLKQEAPDLTRLSQNNHGAFPALHVRNTITFGRDDIVSAHGSKEMPVWGPLFHKIELDQDLGYVRLENVTKYLESLQRK